MLPRLLRRGGHGHGCCCRRLSTRVVVAMARPWRPELDDVDRLSKGGPSSKRGTGNRNIPHRLNAEERPVYDGAKKKGYLVVNGTGYRRARKGSPLPNIFRQWCDAKAQPCIVVEQPLGGNERTSAVVVDLAPLRMVDLTQWEAACRAAAAANNARELFPPDRTAEDVPFNISPVPIPPGPAPSTSSAPKAVPGAAGQTPAAAPQRSLAQADEVAAAVAQQAELVKGLKGAGLPNQHPDVQREVQALLKLKQQLQALQQQAADAGGGGVASPPEAGALTGVQPDRPAAGEGAAPGSPAAATSSGHNPNSDAGAGSWQQASTAHTGEATQHADKAERSSAVSSSSGSSGSSGGDQAAPSSHDGGQGEDTTDAISSSSSSRQREVLPDGHPYATVAIWQLPARPLFFELDRGAAKVLAKELVDRFSSRP